MAVDHGLEGRNSEKSRIRRERKAKRLRQLAKKLQSEDVAHNQREVKFDENARVNFLTGFRKRKEERRKYGLTMQILKEKKQRKEAVKSRNRILIEAKEQAMKKDGAIPLPESDDDGEGDDNDNSSLIDESSVFADDATVSMFGSAVSVVVSDQIGEENDLLGGGEEDSDEDEDGDADSDAEGGGGSVSSRISAVSAASIALQRKKEANKKKQISNFERAMKKAKQEMGTKKSKKKDLSKATYQRKKLNKKVESRQLLTKALGTKGMQVRKRKEKR